MTEEFERDAPRNQKSRFWLVVLVASITALLTTSVALEIPFGRSKDIGRPVSIVVNDAPLNREEGGAVSFSPMVKKAVPSVVNIFTRRRVNVRQGGALDHPLFEFFFGDRFGGERTVENLGSGVIATEDGFILTNHHVVQEADEIKVTLANKGKEYEARVIGRDPMTDLAVLKIEAENLPSAILGDSEQLEVGDIVLAVGNPFGIGQTVTMGIVSALGRGGMDIEAYEDFIQTDAAINPGNSGGALIDATGRVIGINTAIISRTGGNQGIGFAVPINLVRYVMEKLIEEGEVNRGFLGVAMQDVTPELAEAFDLSEAGGALVSSVVEGSAAAEAGIESGDIIVSIGDRTVQDSRRLRLIIGRHVPGDKVEVGVIRHGEEKSFEAVLQEMPAEVSLAGGGRPQREPKQGDLQGATIVDLNRSTRGPGTVPEDLTGALVVRVQPGSPAAAAGLREGDVIREINHQPVESAAEALAMAGANRGERILLRIWRDGGSLYLVIQE